MKAEDNRNTQIQRFESYEEQVAFFVEKTHRAAMPMTQGPGAFFRHFGTWFKTYDSRAPHNPVASIPANPALSMSFPTPLDVLSTALSMHRPGNRSESEALDLIAQFGLCQSMSTQPIATLSGGELLLLGFARAKAMLPVVTGMVACSPVHWLSRGRHKYWHMLVDDFERSSKRIDVALLSGERLTPDAVSETDWMRNLPSIDSIQWTLVVDNPLVVFPEVRFPSFHKASSIQYSSVAGDFRLMSPTLITGDNGVGKSVFAKLLSGVIAAHRPSVRCQSENGHGMARLVFQDSIHQLFGKSVDSHFDMAFRFDKSMASLGKAIYSSIEESTRKKVCDGHFECSSAFGEAGRHSTLLHAKLSLIAERIAARPPLLILDEPGWGLSKRISCYLIREVCRHAHKYGVAVAIISHQSNWWKGVVNSHIALAKQDSGIVSIASLETQPCST